METKFRESIDKAVHNPNLTGALGRFSEAYRTSRQKAYEGYDFEALRTQIADRKSYAASHLDELADLFTRNAEARGHRVAAPPNRRSTNMSHPERRGGLS